MVTWKIQAIRRPARQFRSGHVRLPFMRLLKIRDRRIKDRLRQTTGSLKQNAEWRSLGRIASRASPK